MHETQTTIRYRVRNKEPLWREYFFPWGLLGLLLILLPLLYGLFWFAKNEIQNTVQTETREALARQDLAWVDVNVDGQEVVLTGQGPKREGDRAIAIAEQVKDKAWFSRHSVPTDVRGEFSEPAKAQEVAVKPKVQEPKPVAQPSWGRFTSSLKSGVLTLSGTVGSQAEKAALVSAANSKLDPPRITRVIDKIGVAQQSLIPASAKLAERVNNLMPNCRSGEARSLDGVFSIQCQTTLDQKADIELQAKSPLVEGASFGQVAISSASFCTESFANILEGKSIGFAVGSAQLKASSDPLLGQIAEVAKSCDGSIRVEGHTDKTGSLEKNIVLSEARATSVVDALVRLGIKRERLVPEGVGPQRPRAQGDTPQAYALNRRIEFHVIQ